MRKKTPFKRPLKLKVKEITYSKLCPTGQYENERIEIKVEVKSGDGSKEFEAAKKWVRDRIERGW